MRGQLLAAAVVVAMASWLTACGGDGFTQDDWDEIFDTCVAAANRGCGALANAAESRVNEGYDKECVIRLAKTVAASGVALPAGTARSTCDS